MMSMEKPGVKKSRTEKRSEKTRLKLENAALMVFADYGLDAATIDDITQRADLGKGTFYRHFTDKYEIATILVDQAIDHLIGLLRAYDRRPENLTDVLEHLLNAHYRFFQESREQFILLFQGRLLAKLDRQVSEEMEGSYAQYLGELETMLRGFFPEGTDPAKVRRLACAVAGFAFGFLSFAMIGMDADEIETSIQPLRQSFVKSLSTFLGTVPVAGKNEK